MIELSWVAKIFAVFIGFISPMASIIHVVVFLLLLDMLTSIYFQIKMNVQKTAPGYKLFYLFGFIPIRISRKVITGFKTIESGKLRHTLEKLFFYIMILIAFFSFDMFILKVVPSADNAINSLSITNIASVLIAIVEMTSIASNVSKITGNPIFNRIVSVFKSKAEKKLEIDQE
jgi:hypothetical protein